MIRQPILIDTSFLVALVNEHDEHHEAAIRCSFLYEGRPKVVTQAVLLEAGNGLARRFKLQAVVMFDSFFRATDVEVIPITEDLFARSYSLFRSYVDKDWGLVDCVSFIVMRDRHLTDALTLDQHFVQADFQALMRE